MPANERTTEAEAPTQRVGARVKYVGTRKHLHGECGTVVDTGGPMFTWVEFGDDWIWCRTESLEIVQ